jgi:hypothetical protein
MYAYCTCEEFLHASWLTLSSEESGGQGRNRTADAGLFRAALYQLSYLARWLGRGSIGRPLNHCQLDVTNARCQFELRRFQGAVERTVGAALRGRPALNRSLCERVINSREL